jgi:hypothetical protein
MNYKAACCSVALLAAACPASGQGSRIDFGAPQTRSFAESGCSFTLPATGWEWRDSRLAPVQNVKVIAYAQTRAGSHLILRCDPVRSTEVVSKDSYTDFEAQMLRSGRWAKLGARHLTFKGVPAYWLDLESTHDRHGQTILLFFSNSNAYFLQFINDQAPIGEEAESVFNGFNFIGTPRPMLSSPDEKDTELAKEFELGRQYGRGMGILALMGAFSGLMVLGGCLVIWLNRRGLRRR